MCPSASAATASTSSSTSAAIPPTTGFRVFAAKPAPVQIAWVGYPETRGLAAIDYRITDAIRDPEGSDRFSSEKLIRLPHGFCWRSRFEAGPVQSPPVKRTGYITFGSFNQLHKMTPEVIEVWARLLRTEPSSRLFLVASALTNPSVGERVAACFADAGDRSRSTRAGAIVPTPDHLALYRPGRYCARPVPLQRSHHELRGAVDGRPCRHDVRRPARLPELGERLLTAIDLPELIAETAEAYVEIAVSLAHDADRLAALRAGMRERLRTSPLCDVEAMTRAVETAYRDAWRRWCAKSKIAVAPTRQSWTETGRTILA